MPRKQHVVTDAEREGIRRSVADIKADRTRSWNEARAELGLGPSLQIKKHNYCYDCGEELRAGLCGGWHARLVDDGRIAFSVEYCCKCAGHG